MIVNAINKISLDAHGSEFLEEFNLILSGEAHRVEDFFLRIFDSGKGF